MFLLGKIFLTKDIQLKNNIFKLSNPYFFWILITLLIFITMIFSEGVFITTSDNDIKNNSSITEQSYSNTDSDKYILDIDNIHTNDYTHNSSLIETSYKKLIPNNMASASFYIYTLLISLLFIYREKQNRVKLILLEKQEDALQIELAKQSDINIYSEIEKEIEKYASTFNPELDASTFKELLYISPISVISASRRITEKIITKLYDKHFAYEKPFALRIVILQKNNYITNDMSNLAHTVKAFGNKASHPNETVFTNKDALLVVSSLLHLVENLDTANILEN